jgi:hypothetical protein
LQHVSTCDNSQFQGFAFATSSLSIFQPCYFEAFKTSKPASFHRWRRILRQLLFVLVRALHFKFIEQD